MDPEIAKILCIDDEPNLLSALRRNLCEHFEVLTATSGEEGLHLLQTQGPFAVVLSDMRMPNMDGATFLEKARGLAPDTVRMLLTGQTDITSAISAVNEGQIFRFLTKPCPNQQLLSAFEAAVQQHALITAERELLEKTLRGSIKTLTDVLALVSPAAFGRAQRIQQYALALAEKINLPERWLLDVSAMLSQLGMVTLPGNLIEKIYAGKPLSAPELLAFSSTQSTTEQLLSNIPRLEKIRWILANYNAPLSQLPESQVGRCARILRIAADFELLEEQKIPTQDAINAMRAREGAYAQKLLEAFALLVGGEAPEVIRELMLRELCVGMILAQEVRTKTGMLLVARGYEITPTFLERIRNFPQGDIKEPILIKLKIHAASKLHKAS